MSFRNKDWRNITDKIYEWYSFAIMTLFHLLIICLLMFGGNINIKINFHTFTEFINKLNG